MNRRSFLNQSSLFSAALFSGISLDINARSIQKIGLSLKGWSGISDQNELESFQKIKRLGFSWVEIFARSAGNQLGDFDKTLQAIKKSGLKALSCDLPLGTGEELPENIPSLKAGLEPFAKKFSESGGRFLVCSRIPQLVRQKLSDYENLAKILNEAGEVCANSGLQFCYSAGEADFQSMNDIVPFHQLLAQCNPKKVKVKLDLGPFQKTQQSLEWLIQSNPDRFPLLELKDYDRTKNKIIQPGKGIFDFKEVLIQTQKAGFEWFSLEWPERKPLPEEDLSQAISYFKKIKF